MPASAQRVMTLTSQSDVRLEAVIEAVSRDVALAGEVLRIANSPVYGVRGTIATLEQATMTLGLRELNAMATAMAMLAAFGSEHELHSGLHERSLLAGAVARRVACEMGVDPSIAFLAGLLSEMGTMACLAIDGDAYGAILTADDRAARELERYGASAGEIGAGLLARNGLPASVVDAVAGRGDGQLTALTRFARAAAAHLIAAGQSGDLEGLDDDLQGLASRLDPVLVAKAPALVEQCIAVGIAARALAR